MKSIMEEASSILKAIEKGWHNAGQPKEFTVKIFEEPQKNFIGITTKNAKIGLFFNEEQLAKQQAPTKQRERAATAYSGTAQTGKEFQRPERQRAQQTRQQPEKPQAKHKLQVRPLTDKSATKDVANKARMTGSTASGSEANEPVTTGAISIGSDRQAATTAVGARRKEEKAKETTKFKTQEGSISEEAKAAPQQPIWTEDMLDTIKKWIKETLDMLNLSNIDFTIEPSHFHLKILFKSHIYEDQTRERQLFSSLSTLLIQMLKYRYSRPLKGYKIILTSESNNGSHNKTTSKPDIIDQKVQGKSESNESLEKIDTSIYKGD